MPEQMRAQPSLQNVKQIVRQIFNESVLTAERFESGSCHFVFDVVTESGRNVVVRVAYPENKRLLQGSIYWQELLLPKGIPLAKILAFDLNAAFPFLILEKLAGQDLGFVYQQLSKSEKQQLAQKLIVIQKATASLPLARGFGFLESYESDLFLPTWTDVLQQSLARSRERIKNIGILNAQDVDRVEEKLVNYANCFAQIQPFAFLDDITTKNVIVHEGKLSGIVDVDCVCFGDNLFTVALTRMSLLNTNDNLDYTEFWCNEMNLDVERRKILDFYTALFCVDFMSEKGQRFNKEKPAEINLLEVKRLQKILDALLASI